MNMICIKSTSEPILYHFHMIIIYMHHEASGAANKHQEKKVI